MIDTAPGVPNERRGAILALTVPAFVGALAILIAILAAGLTRRAPDGARARSPVAFGNAVREDDLYAVYDAIRQGRNPNAAVPYRDQDHTANREIMAAPLLIAIANTRENMVMLLLSYGVTLDAPANAGAVCLARTIKAESIIKILVRQGGAQLPDQCPDVPDGELPLVVFAARAQP